MLKTASVLSLDGFNSRCAQDQFQHTVQIPQDIVIGNAQYFYSLSMKGLGTSLVILFSSVMTFAI